MKLSTRDKKKRELCYKRGLDDSIFVEKIKLNQQIESGSLIQSIIGKSLDEVKELYPHYHFRIISIDNKPCPIKDYYKILGVDLRMVTKDGKKVVDSIRSK